MSDAVSDSERVTGRAGVQQARRALKVRYPIVWQRDIGMYMAGGNEFRLWSEAAEWVLEQTEGEA